MSGDDENCSYRGGGGGITEVLSQGPRDMFQITGFGLHNWGNIVMAALLPCLSCCCDVSCNNAGKNYIIKQGEVVISLN